jgi:2-polyprenyl-3-methyl-5-hydroxy-6-metoxy-1,4-benzoquinol methylase
MSLGAYTLGYKTFAIDVIDTWVNKPALDMRGIPFIQHNIEDGPIPDVPPADVVIFTEVLEHLNCNPVLALTNIRKGMKPGALLILSTPRRESGRHNPGIYQEEQLNPSEFRPHWKYIPETRNGKAWVDAHTYIYTEYELRHLVELCGFSILQFGLAWNGITSGILAFKDSRTDEAVTDWALYVIREQL